MKLSRLDLLQRYIEDRGCSQAQLARAAGCSRQFVWALANGTKERCSDEIAAAIEEKLGLLTGTLFVPDESDQIEQALRSDPTTVAA